MKTAVSVVIASFAFAAAAAYAQTYREYYDKSISTLYSAGTSTCITFQLTGVTEAHPNVSGNPWFAIEKADKESYALLLSARVARTPLNRVLADGSLACGMARAHVIEL
jgi:hypothetical protein